MFGLPLWAIDLIIDFLEAIGKTSASQAIEAKLYIKIKSRMENMKTDYSPSAFPNSSASPTEKR